MKVLAFLITGACFATSSFDVAGQTAVAKYRTGAAIIVGPSEGCPIFVGSVASKSPAERAGIRAGDRLLTVDSKDVKGIELAQVAALMRSEQPGSIRLKLWRAGKEYEVLVEREKHSSILAAAGMKQAGPFVVPQDTTEAEIKRMVDIQNGRRTIAGRVFPLHYPLNPDLYYGGFEVFILDDPAQVVIGGLEQGPASRAGIHQGDVILSVNGISPAGRSREELEALFSANQARRLKLVVDRVTFTKTFEFELEKTSDIMKQNHRRLVGVTLIPDGLADEDVQCFVSSPDTRH